MSCPSDDDLPAAPRTTLYDGLPPADPAGEHTVVFANCSHVVTQAAHLSRIPFHTLFLAVHSLPPQRHADFHNSYPTFYAKHLSSLDAERRHGTAGTGILHRLGPRHPVHRPAPRHPELRKLNHAGRIGLYGIEPMPGVLLLVYVIYGYTNGEHSKDAADRTSALLEILPSRTPPANPLGHGPL